jgi:hypothetical protein
VKCHRQRPGGFDQLRRPILCDLLGRGERTSHNPLRSCRFCCLNLLLHCAMLAWLVNEIPDTRSHKHENRNGQLRNTRTKEARIRCRPIVREICAQLDAMRAAFGGGTCCLDRLDGRFD